MTNHFEAAKGASEMAEKHNKSITYILMLIHEGRTQFQDINQIKGYVAGKLVSQ